MSTFLDWCDFNKLSCTLSQPLLEKYIDDEKLLVDSKSAYQNLHGEVLKLLVFLKCNYKSIVRTKLHFKRFTGRKSAKDLTLGKSYAILLLMK